VTGIRCGSTAAAVLQRTLGHRLAAVQAAHPSPALLGNSSSATAIAAAALARQSQLQQNLNAAAAAGLHGGPLGVYYDPFLAAAADPRVQATYAAAAAARAAYGATVGQPAGVAASFVPGYAREFPVETAYLSHNIGPMTGYGTTMYRRFSPY